MLQYFMQQIVLHTVPVKETFKGTVESLCFTKTQTNGAEAQSSQ